MSRCFRILGLSDTATKEQVQAAYERRVRHYKGPDFMEEPEYAHKKLLQLKGAYEEAMRLAGTSSAYSRPAQRESMARSTEKKSSYSSKLRDAERKDAELGLSEKFHQLLEKRDENKARKTNKDDRKKGITRGTSKGASAAKGKLKLPDLDFNKLKDVFDELTAALGPEDGVSKTNDSGQRLNQNGSGTVMKKTGKQESKNNTVMGVISTVLSLVIALMALVGACEGEDITYDSYDSGLDYIYNYDYDEIADKDSEISGIASSTNSFLYEQGGDGGPIDADDNVSMYIDQANQFAKTYWGMDRLSEVTDYLYENYSGYTISSQASLDKQLDGIFNFYGFMPLDDAVWYYQPYTGETVQGYGDYLDYLNQYYEEFGDGN